MIEKMKKVSIVVLDSTRKESVKALRKVGVVHLEEMEGKGPLLASYKDAAVATDKAISILEEIKLPKKQIVNQLDLTNDAALETANKIVSLSDEKKSLYEAIARDTNELERLSKWGNVDPADFVDLAKEGIFVYMYEIPEDKYETIGKELKTVKVNAVGKIVRFLLLSDEEVTERPSLMPAEAYAVPMLEMSSDAFRDNILKAKQTISRIESELLDDKKYLSALTSYREVLASDIEFETVCSGMGCEESDENAESEEVGVLDSISRTKLAWLSGYVPVALLPNFVAACKENSWAYAAADPADDDPVPTKLKNSKLVSIIYPLMDFLDVTPGYHEFDISGWFLFFFCIFFAMIFGDACYGALIAIVGLALLATSKKGGRSLGVLVTLLGCCTMLWGIMTCSWFGISPEKLPKALVDISFAPFSAAKSGSDVANTNQKIFCFSLALIQLSVAHLKCMVADRKSLKFFGDMGSLFMIWGMFYVVMNMVVDGTKYPLGDTGIPIPIFGGRFVLPSNFPLISIGVLGVGFVLNFIFANYEGSIGKSVLESVKNIISVLLGVVNQFSDIVSYIRLWAVALAGAAISETVNQMAGPMFGKLFMVIFGVVLLVFGHGLNMILNLLSVIVHGVRLNTLEFSQHLGMTWSGVKYRPFSERREK
ncbi:MAG: ATPase [Treponema sp.]|nr:ATPase [Treponema sp.]